MAAAHALGVLANWMVQLALDIYRSIQNSLTVRTKEGRPAGMDCKELKRLARRTAGNTLKGSASLILASFGAGLGTILIRPSTGTWIGMLPTILTPSHSCCSQPSSIPSYFSGLQVYQSIHTITCGLILN